MYYRIVLFLGVMTCCVGSIFSAPDAGTKKEASVQAMNLIQNALQSTHKGDRITLSVRPVGDSVRIAVQDTGPGIDSEHIPHIFDRFYRPAPSAAVPVSGSGLGLAIAKRAVELHQSDLRCESAPGQGALFWFDLQASSRS